MQSISRLAKDCAGMYLDTYGSRNMLKPANWLVLLHADFAREAVKFPKEARIGLAAMIEVLQTFGPQLRRPHCDTLKGSRHPNMKELRFDAANGVWRIAFAFDAKRSAVLLVGGDKAGVSEARFYKSLIRRADERFDQWIEDTK
jgi:hypothetical protein